MTDYLVRGDRRERYLTEDEGDLSIRQFLLKHEHTPPHWTQNRSQRERLIIALHEIGEPPFRTVEQIRWKIGLWAHSRMLEPDIGISRHRTEVGVLWDYPHICDSDEKTMGIEIARAILPVSMLPQFYPEAMHNLPEKQSEADAA